jgi:hypothetical protein
LLNFREVFLSKSENLCLSMEAIGKCGGLVGFAFAAVAVRLAAFTTQGDE